MKNLHCQFISAIAKMYEGKIIASRFIYSWVKKKNQLC